MSSSNSNDSTVLHDKNHNEIKHDEVSALQEQTTFLSGDILGENFRLENRLGRGGMGEAWKAYDQTADRFVVLKFIPKEIQHAQEAMDLLRSSFKKVHTLQHQHICPVYGLFTDPQHGLYLAMKYIDGVSLDVYRRKYVKKHGKILFSDIVQILWGIAKGLDYAHERKVIHRDIKPLNVMIGKSDGVQIIDFGLAEDIRTCITRFSREPQMSVAGTRPYMAPEQWRGRLQDAQTDQYALAVTAYEMFSGHVPFFGNDIAILRECVLNEEVTPIAELPEYINNALLKALSKKREDRYENCRAFIKAMVTKPQESENTKTTTNEILPDKTNTESKDRWLPSTIFVSLESSSSVQKVGTQIKNIKPRWFVLSAIFIAIIVSAAGLFLMQKTHRPTVSPQLSLATQPIEQNTESSEKTEEKPKVEPPTPESINTTPSTVELSETRQERIVQKQPVDDPPKENITEEKTKTNDKTNNVAEQDKDKSKSAKIENNLIQQETVLPEKQSSQPEVESIKLLPNIENLQEVPFAFLKRISETESEIRTKGGFAVAGQVWIDGQPAKLPSDFDVRANDEPTYHFPGGWFITRLANRTKNPSIKACGLQTEVKEFPVQFENDKVNFYQLSLVKAPNDQLIDINGRVVSEDGKPIKNAKVYIHTSVGNGGNFGVNNIIQLDGIMTNGKGDYRIPKVFPHRYYINVGFNGFDSSFTTTQSSVAQDIVLKHPRRVIVDVVYQPNGSTDFTENVRKMKFELLTNNHRVAKWDSPFGNSMKFDLDEKTYPTDLRLGQGDQLYFSHGYGGKNEGCYDAGEVDFDSVKEAQLHNFSKRQLPCYINHVYVVRTYDKGHYAKFVVRKIEVVTSKYNK